MRQSDTQLILDKLASLETRFDKLETRFSDVETQLISVNNRLNSVEGELLTISEQTSMIPGIVKALGNISGDLDAHEQRFKKLEVARA